MKQCKSFNAISWNHSKRAKSSAPTEKKLELDMGSLSLEPCKNGPSLSDYQGSIMSGFQMAAGAGPLCAEPMSGVCFSIEHVEFFVDEDTDSK